MCGSDRDLKVNLWPPKSDFQIPPPFQIYEKSNDRFFTIFEHQKRVAISSFKTPYALKGDEIRKSLLGGHRKYH